jgi:hypothetical protein
MYPLLKDTIDYNRSLEQLRNYVPKPKTTKRNTKQEQEPSQHKITWKIKNDYSSLLVRAIQEQEILKTRLQMRKSGKLVELPSFHELWCREDSPLSREIMESGDPHESKWILQEKYGYKIATTFMPEYAKAIYSYFGIDVDGGDTKSRKEGSFWVLDPCAGWGDRLFAAGMCPFIDKYVAFDPNFHLRPGYTEIMEKCGYRVSDSSDRSLIFSNGFEIHSLPFERGIRVFPKNTFHLAFTSPPFYNYEVYTEDNPVYNNWETEFYQPLFTEVARVLVPGGHFCLHMSETSAGNLTTFLEKWVVENLPFRFLYKFGLIGTHSNKTRDVWVYQCIKSGV